MATKKTTQVFQPAVEEKAKVDTKKSFRFFNVQRDFEDATLVMAITYPGMGDTGETLTLRSRYSKQFREASSKATRQMSSMIMANKGKPLAEDIVKDIEDRQFMSLIADWSFEEPCTHENLVEFFDSNPQMYDLVNNKAAQDSLFLKSNETE